MIIDCISDLHGFYPELEGGDLLIIAGDLTAKDTEKQYDDFWRWLCYQNYKKCIVISGNHDNYLQKHPYFLTDCGDNIHYLCDSGIEFESLKIWGSPWTKTFEGMNPHCKAFTVDTEEELAEKWALIPKDTDILITHEPPRFIFDLIGHHNIHGKNPADKYYVGSLSLRNEVIDRIKPKLHVFGHIHECGGRNMNTIITHFVNASHVNERYEPVNKPIRVIL